MSVTAVAGIVVAGGQGEEESGTTAAGLRGNSPLELGRVTTKPAASDTGLVISVGRRLVIAGAMDIVESSSASLECLIAFLASYAAVAA
jgi:hypothetical protein